MNNKKNILLILLGVVVLAQLYFPISMIVSKESTIQEGVKFKFTTTPIDPYDPFIGRYIILNYDIDMYNRDEFDTEKFVTGQVVYVYLFEDYEGYAAIRKVSLLNTEEGYYVKAKIAFATDNMLRLNFPFNRYYMRETKAKEAEQLHERMARNGEHATYALIAVKNGEAVIEGVYIDDIPIEEYVDMIETKQNNN